MRPAVHTTVGTTALTIDRCHPGRSRASATSIWHLAFIRAIAAATPEAQGNVPRAAVHPCGRVARRPKPCVGRRRLYFAARRGAMVGAPSITTRLAGLLRRQRFGTVWILDRTLRPAARGVARRHPGAHRAWASARSGCSSPIAGIDRRHFHDMPTDWLAALLAVDQGAPALDRARPDAAGAAGPRHRASAMPACRGPGSWSGSAPRTRQGLARSALAGARPIAAAGDAGTVFLIGGAANAGRAASLIAVSAGAKAVNACDLTIFGGRRAACSRADLFVGTGFRPMNLAAAVGTPALRPVRLDPGPASFEIHPRDRCRTDGRGPAPDGDAADFTHKCDATHRPYLSALQLNPVQLIDRAADRRLDDLVGVRAPARRA